MSQSPSTLTKTRAAITALLALSQQQQIDLARGIALPDYAVSRRQGATPWGLDEADRVAAHFGIDPLDLFAGPEKACSAYARRHGLSHLAEFVTTSTDEAAADTEPAKQTAAPHDSDLEAEVTTLATPARCVLCNLPTTTTLEGFPQHVSAEACAEAGETAALAAAPAPEPATTAPASAEPDRPRRERKEPRPRQERAETHANCVAFLRRNVQAALKDAGGDMEAAATYLEKKAIPHAMELLDISRAQGRYDVIAYPPLPDAIYKKPSKSKPNQVWEARPHWRRRWDTLPLAPGTHTVDELDMNGAYLSALKTHLPLGEPEHTTGAINTLALKRSGVHLVTPGEWHHDHLPNPIGARDEPGPLWIMEPTLRLLNRLASPKNGNLCAPPEIHESWTSGSTEHLLEYFRTALTEVRAQAIAEGDELSELYVKAIYSKFVSTAGTSSANHSLVRPDWAHTIRSQAFSNLYGKALKAHAAGLHVVRLSGTDELHVIGAWRSVFDEGRGVTEVKLKKTSEITISPEA
ncbi:hypothetical protein OG730_41675 (plasmid) [Streptomyces sp. NBC_01298]|uniref:hypothetical protein n=1 Tax=Streptomyces sp. NBC_01298 TaxID=2903817 RepID=UPI002E145C0A|nr:hypothetical protein OG730_41675 [Streptomyces sp. NBC_01298]